MLWFIHYWRLFASYFKARPVAELDVDGDDELLALSEAEQVDEPGPDLDPTDEPPVVLAMSPTPPTPPRLAPLAVGDDGWLVGPGVIKVPTTRGGYQWRTKSKQPGGFLLHWTATSHGTAAGMLARSKTGKGGSVHFWIEDNGTIYQQVPLTRGAGHAASKVAKRLKQEKDGRIVTASSGYTANSYLIGCEAVQVGEVRWVKIDGGKWIKALPHEKGAVAMGWPFGAVDKETGKPRKGPIVKPEQIVEGVDDGRRRLYQDHTPAQLVAIERLMTALRDRYGFDDDALSWGHVSVDPTRKRDPGPVYFAKHLPEMLERMRDVT